MLTWVPNRDAPFVRNLVAGESAVSRYGYRNEAYQQGLRQAAAETDPAKATEIYQRLEEMVLRDAVVIPLYYSRPQ
jgi:ABC-type oligopeptide transport system substrate-binding subunit